ncbi:HD-GYP domain-containing protein [Marinobacterium arenosum]|uniref:HD-GYP domain-containing protein n=1 Tax=Marinobacterium arenosum TaxID=2862496 RepID=UPI001C938D4A|nr:HD domain-containing phosphohydrolase [Marinobacterium arenosum]MBY4677494.1 HD domain-containing protein [Marinobacterium arenosum]
MEARKAQQALQKYDLSHYADHLTEIGPENAVLAREDIRNSAGALLVPKGQRLDRVAMSRLRQHALDKILDLQISVEGCLDGTRIYRQILELIEQYPGCQQVQARSGHSEMLREVCLSEPIAPPLLNKLTVMRQRLPKAYNHSLFTAWVCLLIASEMGLPKAKIRKAFACGLLHDIGLLHVPESLTRRRELSPEEWQALQSHAVIGYLIVRALDVYPPSVAEGVLEHHERLDQTGYPTRKPAECLGLYGQLVGCADLLFKFGDNEVKDHPSRLAASLPYLRMHQGAYSEDIFNAIVRILSRCDYQPRPTAEPAEMGLQRVLMLNLLVMEMGQQLKSLLSLELVPLIGESRSGQALLAMAESLVGTLRRTGLDAGYLLETLGVEQGEPEPAALDEVSAMLHELLWLLKRFCWSVTQYLDDEGGTVDLEPLRMLTEQLQARLQQAWQLETPYQAGAQV